MKKTDITSIVIGKLNKGTIDLYRNKVKIGELNLKTSVYQVESSYVVENHRIYVLENEPENIKQFVFDCDLGWC
ncbi:DUF2553 family protein [Guptibacillus algicola]|uniref:DUF2553 family protein n=1 Tax=Guptibacillus algicola TaxID=225844 RepID=UPI001CD61786|nr:DUF2553 family protein [Alkalihalobacillus algicola]MCA0988260.1 YusG family protein [Alkalihalobacillus algicola]